MFIQKLLVQGLAAYNALKKITSTGSDERPVVFWHGMGDSYNSTAIQRVLETVHEEKPNVFTHSVYVKEKDDDDQKASFFGKVHEQIDDVCVQLASIPELEKGFDFIGFSQGGLFARAAIEKCGLKVNTLITFGSPHAGVFDLPKCNDHDWLCKRKNALLKRQVWRDSIQGSVISAQYFRDPLDYDRYLEHSAFLADVNNEREVKNQTYTENLAKLEKLVLIQFEQDTTLVPKESAWFYDNDKVTGVTIPFNESDFYNYDCVGLKRLYDENKIEYLSIDDNHMNIGDHTLRKIIQKYIGKPFTC